MRVTDKEVLHRMCDKIKLSDTQKEDIMKKINEEATEKKQKHFNMRRFAAVAASVLVLAGATVYVEAKFGIVDRVSNLYNIRQNEEVVLDVEEREVLEEISLDTLEVGCEFEVDGGRIRVDGITYDSTYIYFMYTSFADEATPETPINLLTNMGGLRSGFKFFIKGKEWIDGGTSRCSGDLDEYEEGYQSYFVFRVSPNQYEEPIGNEVPDHINNFSLSQGDVIVLTDRKYYEHIGIDSLDELEKIYGTFTLTKPINAVVFNCENTEGLEALETVTEIRLTPLSITIMGDELLRKTYPEGIGYTYIERGDRVIKFGSTGDEETASTRGGYAMKVVKKDGTVVEYGGVVGHNSGLATGEEFEHYFDSRTFEKPLDLSEVDHILVWGWGQELKIPVNVE